MTRFSDTIRSGWVPELFTAALVVDIAKSACPKFEFVGEAGLIAYQMNEATADLLIGLNGAITAAEAKAWASAIAEAMAAPEQACGPRLWDTALRLGIDPKELKDFCEKGRAYRHRALQYALEADKQKTIGRPENPPSVDAWLQFMQTAYFACFGRRVKVTYNSKAGKRVSPAADFIAGIVRCIQANQSIVDQCPSILAALAGMQNPAHVAGKMRTLVDKESPPKTRVRKVPEF